MVEYFAMKNIEDYTPKNKSDWRKWLELNHNKKEAVWLVFYKKNSPQYNLSWSESVNEALCFGWIDSTKRTIDNNSYKQYFTKRKAKSNWSRINKDKVENLIAQGLMQASGYKSIALAKENGSWILLDSVEALIVPQDLEEALEKYNGSKIYFDKLSKSEKKILLYWIVSAKRDETRKKRILEIAVNASQNQKPKPFR